MMWLHIVRHLEVVLAYLLLIIPVPHFSPYVTEAPLGYVSQNILWHF